MEDKNRFQYKAYIIGDAILKKRKEMRKTQEELAEILEMDVKQLGALERGESVPSLATIAKLHMLLGIDINLLIQEIWE